MMDMKNDPIDVIFDSLITSGLNTFSYFTSPSGFSLLASLFSHIFFYWAVCFISLNFRMFDTSQIPHLSLFILVL